jgi:RHS repeat-associated protein
MSLLHIEPRIANSYYHADGGGNITAMIFYNQSIAAKYHYDPYGNILDKSGQLCEANIYRFSSKEYDISSGLIYYLYRYYDASSQRWITRDPLEELPDPNLYRFVLNRPTVDQDERGLFLCSILMDKLGELLEGLPGAGAKAACGACGGSSISKCKSCCDAAEAADAIYDTLKFAATLGCSAVEIGSVGESGLGIIDIILAHKKFIKELKDLQRENEECYKKCEGTKTPSRGPARK